MVNILLNSESRYPINRKEIKKAVREILTLQGIKSDTEVSISIVGDRKMTDLNEKYLKRTGTTDVLSFPLGNMKNGGQSSVGFINPPDDVLHLGDIVISYPQAVKQAGENNILVMTEICNLVKHGLLHLLGINHE